MGAIEQARENLERVVASWKLPDGIELVAHTIVTRDDSIYLTLTIRAHGAEQIVGGNWLYWIFTDCAAEAMKVIHRRWSDNIKRIAEVHGKQSESS